jgi:hypothetical protein
MNKYKQDNSEVNLEDMECDGMEWIQSAQDMDQ